MSDRRQQLREMEKVISRVMKTAAKYDSIGKTEFEAILHKIMQQVEKNTSANLDQISALTPKVLADMPKEYGQVSEENRSMEAMVGYLYGKYLKELGLLK
jgi:hypothetical protein